MPNGGLDAIAYAVPAAASGIVASRLMDADALIWAGAGFGIAGVALLRYAWSLPQRSIAWNAAGWGALVVAMVCGALGGGAWGASVAMLVATGAAFVALAIAGVRAPQGRGKASDRRVRMLPQPGEPRRIGRRVVTFLLVIPGGMIAAFALGLVIRGLGEALRWHPADANMAALYMVPFGWAVVATLLLMQERRRSQIVTLLACVLAALPFLLIGARA